MLASGNITHPCNSRYLGKIFLYIDHNDMEYLYNIWKNKTNSVRIRFLSRLYFCSTLDRIWTHSFDKLHHLSLSLMPAPYMLNIALWVYYAYLYVVLNEDMNENFNITVKAANATLGTPITNWWKCHNIYILTCTTFLLDQQYSIGLLENFVLRQLWPYFYLCITSHSVY